MSEIEQPDNNTPSTLKDNTPPDNEHYDEEEASGDGEDYDDDYGDALLCTYAATGPNMTFQPIYNCLTCSSSSLRANSRNDSSDNDDVNSNTNNICCICEGCAYACHADHEVEMIGHAPAYCDCHTVLLSSADDKHADDGTPSLCCQLKQCSLDVALDIGIPSGGKVTETFVEVVAACSTLSNEEKATSANSVSAFNWSHECRAFQIGCLLEGGIGHDDNFSEPSEFCRTLLDQARALADNAAVAVDADDDNGGHDEDVNNSNRTYWVPYHSDNASTTTYCEMELFALLILKRHIEAYGLEVTPHTGAEWWVQVKPCKSGDDTNTAVDCPSEGDSAVDIHYDKDEKLAQTFGLGYFPVLSTVTYLSSNHSANPTVVFSHTYETAQDHPINSAVISHAERGKHLVFDGRLLHGAPAHPRLRRDVDKLSLTRCYDDMRVTFLVNVWMNGKPLDAIELNEKTRKLLKSRSKPCFDIEITSQGADFNDLHISSFAMNEVNQCGKNGKIFLPFISAEAAWIDHESGTGTYVSMYPPDRHESLTFRIDYGSNFVAHISSGDDDGED